MGWRSIGRNHVPIGLISISTNLNGLLVVVGSRQRKESCPNTWILFLASTSTLMMLYVKISKKLDYWSTRKLSFLAHMMTICNHILLSTMWFFITILGGSNRVLRRIRGAMWNFLWSSKEQLTRTMVSWKECCLKKKLWGLGLVDPKMAKTSHYVNGLWKPWAKGIQFPTYA